MVLAVARKCTKQIYLIFGAVMVIFTVMYSYPGNLSHQKITKERPQYHRPRLKILSYKNNEVSGEELVSSSPSNNNLVTDKRRDERDEKEAGKGDDEVSVPRVITGATSISDKEQIRLNMEDLETKEERRHKPSVQKVIIFTYMRSGSTLTGDLFQHHPNVFYVFEPLWRLQKFYNDQSQVISYLNGNAIRDRFPYGDFWTPRSMSSQVLENMLSCNLHDLDVDTLRMGHFGTSKTTLLYSRCLQFHPEKKSIQAVKDCFPLLQVPCSKANVTVVKTIRYTIEQLQKLLNTDQDIKVIYLIRDPRGTLNSQYRVGEYKWANREEHFSKFCLRLRVDLKNVHAISKLYADRILLVRYEDIVQYPIASAKFMYDFVGLQITDQIKSYIWNITYAGAIDKKCRGLCTMRANSTYTAYKWRKAIKFEDIEKIDAQCSDIYSVLGYRRFTNNLEYHTLQILSRYDEFGSLLKYTKLMTLRQLEAMPESNNIIYIKQQESKNLDFQKQQEIKILNFLKQQESRNSILHKHREGNDFNFQREQENKSINFLHQNRQKFNLEKQQESKNSILHQQQDSKNVNFQRQQNDKTIHFLQNQNSKNFHFQKQHSINQSSTSQRR